MARNPWWAPWALRHMIEPSMRVLTRQIPELAGMKAGERVLDVCCGTGGLTISYAERGLIATGLDLDPRVIKIADRRVARRGLTNVNFHTGSAVEMPFPDNSFDHASITMGLHELTRPDRDEIISEMKRVVCSQGTLTFLDYRAPLPRGPLSWTARIAEFLAGHEHNGCFRDYLRQGGLAALLDRHQLPGERKKVLTIVEIMLARTAP